MREDQDQGSFLTGFTLGLFAGAAGLYLFGTEKGKSVRQRLTSEWQAAQSSMQPSTLAATAAPISHSIRDLVKQVIAEITASDNQTAEAASSNSKRGSSKTKPGEAESAPKQLRFKNAKQS